MLILDDGDEEDAAEEEELLPGDLLPPGNEPRASAAHHDVIPDGIYGQRHGEPVPIRSKTS